MPKAKIAISIEEGRLAALDRLVQAGVFGSRSAAVEAAIAGLVDRAVEKAYQDALRALDEPEESGLAEEWLSGEADAWRS